MVKSLGLGRDRLGESLTTFVQVAIIQHVICHLQMLMYWNDLFGSSEASKAVSLVHKIGGLITRHGIDVDVHIVLLYGRRLHEHGCISMWEQSFISFNQSFLVVDEKIEDVDPVLAGEITNFNTFAG